MGGTLAGATSLPGWAAPKVTSEYNFATGDDVANDGKRQTFDQLYPTGHDKLGLADQVGWRNIHHLREGIEITPIKQLRSPSTTTPGGWPAPPMASTRRAARYWYACSWRRSERTSGRKSICRSLVPLRRSYNSPGVTPTSSAALF